MSQPETQAERRKRYYKEWYVKNKNYHREWKERNHDGLCGRALRWLSGSRRCEPVFSNIASCDEIPDAIGWSSCHRWYGSTVIECKTSVSDFYADRKKWKMWKSPKDGWRFSCARISKQNALENGYELVDVSSMGDYRFYFCLPGVLSLELVEKHAPDHGLLWLDGRSVKTIRPAPKRVDVDKDGEIRYLRFAIINRKNPFVGEVLEPEQGQLALER